MMKKITIIAGVVLMAAQLMAFAEEPSVDKVNTLDVSIGAAGVDVLGPEPRYKAVIGLTWGNIMGSGIEARIDTLDLIFYPGFEPSADFYLERQWDIARTPLSWGVGNDLSLDGAASVFASSCLYGTLSYKVGEIEVAKAELDLEYLSDNAFELGLAAVIGGGYSLALGDKDTISAWVDFNLDIYSDLGLGDIEGKLSYGHSFNDTLALSMEFAPTLSPDNDYSLSTQISIGAEITL
jgi:hypothetical protein